MYTVHKHQSLPFLSSAVKTQPQVRPVEQIKRVKKLSKVIQVSFTKPKSADESDTKLARSLINHFFILLKLIFGCFSAFYPSTWSIIPSPNGSGHKKTILQ